MSAIENIIANVAPGYALKRARARMALNVIRGYEGASKGRRTDGWRTAGTSANAETRKALPLLRERARDLVRNNPYAARAVSFTAASIVGYGIKTNISMSNKKNAKAIQAAFLAWSESKECDADGQHDIYGLQELAARTIVESGEVLVRRRWRRPSDGLTVPLQLQVLEPDFIDTTKDGLKNGANEIIQGIEYDPLGRRVAYWLYEQHPGDAYSFSRNTFTSKRIPAEDILHIYRMDRPGQVRGVSWFAPVVIRMRDLDEYEDAQLVRQKIASCFAAFIYDQEPPESTGAASSATLTEHIEPGAMQRLPAGTNITFPSPPTVTGYGEYMSVTLHAIAAGIGIPYESLTGDYSQVNFTSGRMGRGEFHSLLDVWQWKMFVPKFCGGVFGWFVEAAMMAGLPAQGATAKYTPPRRTLVDPTREVPTIIKSIRGGLQTLFGGIREMGYEPEEFLQEFAEANAALDRLGIVLDSDPRKITNGGQAQQVSSNDNADTGAKDDESKAAA